jgi:pimeloyl-ACP methyl ester carboxylesterase
VLHGLFLESPKKKTVLINIHGTASNFYEEDWIESLAKSLNDKNISLLSTNNRGASTYDPYQKCGAAVEKFEDCLKDIDSWIKFVISRGYKKIILSGHSLGTEKTVYYMSYGKYRNKVSAVILLAPSDSYGCQKFYEGQPDVKVAKQTEAMLKKSDKLIAAGRGQDFLPRNAYGGIKGIIPKSAESYVNFLGPNSKLVKALPFHKKELLNYRKINQPILVIIGDSKKEYTAIQIKETLALLKKENTKTETHQIKNCDHCFVGKEKELSKIIINFLSKI